MFKTSLQGLKYKDIFYPLDASQANRAEYQLFMQGTPQSIVTLCFNSSIKVLVYMLARYRVNLRAAGWLYVPMQQGLGQQCEEAQKLRDTAMKALYIEHFLKRNEQLGARGITRVRRCLGM